MSKRKLVVRVLLPAAVLMSGFVNTAAQATRFEQALGLRGVSVVQVGGVEPGMPAERAGLKTSDLILAFNGQSTKAYTDYNAFLDAMRQAAFRGGTTLNILRYDPVSDRYVERSLALSITTEPVDAHQIYLGIRAGPTYYVLDVLDGSVAKQLGLAHGDFIEEVNGQDFRSLGDLDKTVSDILGGSDRHITLWVTRWRPIENGKVGGKGTRRVTGAL